MVKKYYSHSYKKRIPIHILTADPELRVTRIVIPWQKQNDRTFRVMHNKGRKLTKQIHLPYTKPEVENYAVFEGPEPSFVHMTDEFITHISDHKQKYQ